MPPPSTSLYSLMHGPSASPAAPPPEIRMSQENGLLETTTQTSRIVHWVRFLARVRTWRYLSACLWILFSNASTMWRPALYQRKRIRKPVPFRPCTPCVPFAPLCILQLAPNTPTGPLLPTSGFKYCPHRLSGALTI